MKTTVVSTVPFVVVSLAFSTSYAEVPQATGDEFEKARPLLDQLPETTVFALEIRDLARRWEEIRARPTMRRFQERLLSGSGLTPEDLPRLAGDCAVLALATDPERQCLVPLALLRPPRMDDGLSLLEGLSGDGDPDGVAVERKPDAIWVAPECAADALGRMARGGDAEVAPSLHREEVDRALPSGGLVRGWLNSEVLRAFLLRRMEESRPFPVSVLLAFAAAELDAVRFAGFRRDLTPDGIITDAFVEYRSERLPAEVLTALTPRSLPQVLPESLPAGVLAMASFRPESKACVAWIKQVSQSDPRGLLRNLCFWFEQFEDRTGIDVESDLFELVDGEGWGFLLERDAREAIRFVTILEARDPRMVEKSLVHLRSWASEHVLGRSLGLVVPRPRDSEVERKAAYATTLWTPLGEISGPAFLVTDGHLLVGSDSESLKTGLKILETKRSWGPVAEEPEIAGPASQSVVARGVVLSSLLQPFLTANTMGPAGVVSAIAGLAEDVEVIHLSVWFEGDGVRLRGRVQFAE